MYIGKVAGTIVATRKNEKLVGMKLLIVKEIDDEGNFSGNYDVAVDTVGAGFRETVIVVKGSSSRQTSITRDKAVDAAIIGIVDTIDLDPELVTQK